MYQLFKDAREIWEAIYDVNRSGVHDDGRTPYKSRLYSTFRLGLSIRLDLV
jgi:hypothetical protein